LVCSHLYDAKTSNKLEGKSAFPLCVQIYEDGFHLWWYCSKCVEIYGLSNNGTYVYDAEDDFFEKIKTLDDFKIDEDLDVNPFANYIDEQKGFMLTKAEFDNLKVTFDPDTPIEESNLMKIPFGAKFETNNEK